MKRALAFGALVLAMPADAIERIRLQAAQIRAADATLGNVVVNATLLPKARSTIEITATRIALPAGQAELAGDISAFRARCTDAVFADPEFSCPALELDATSSRWGRQTFRGATEYNSATGRIAATGDTLAPGEIPVQLSLSADAASYDLRAVVPSVQVAQAALQLKPWAPLPKDLQLQGTATVQVHLAAHGQSTRMNARASFADAGFQNEDYTFIGENLAFALDLQADIGATPWAFSLAASGTAGQALTGPVLLDFNQHPLQLQLAGTLADNTLAISRFDASLPDLARANGSARLNLDTFEVASAEVEIPELHFPAAYPAFVQLPLATTPFNQLTTKGRATAALAIRENSPTRVDLVLHELAFSDESRALEVTGITAGLHWRADIADPRVSFLAWETSRGWGIAGARTRLEFTTSGRDFQLLKPARLPFFDGALVVNTLAAENLGTDRLSGVFDAEIEPISVAPIAHALGWPEFQGKLSGRIPGLTYQDKMLGLQGNLEADVFGGTVVARNLRISEPLGPWPRLFGNITGRNLDLDLITRTFEIGSITGRLDVDLLNLETFNWSPVAFDLKLATPPGDKSRHRISQRAVQSLSDIGGGGGGVAAALQSGALRFFDEFPYDRLGISCRLRNDVCQIDGVGRAGAGFYLLKGKGLPRIDIIGNNRRVDWPLLVQQVRDALANPGALDVN